MNNLYSFIKNNSEQQPDQLALSIKSLLSESKVEVTYAQLLLDVDNYATSLSNRVSFNDRVIVALPVCYELYVVVFALFKLGSCAVLLNPAMNRNALKASLKLINANSIISNKAILKYRFLFWDILKIKYKISLNSNGFGVSKLKANNPNILLQEASPNQAALISFTSGSSGLPKAVLRSYENLTTQHQYLKKLPSINNHYDITAFPVVALHHLCNAIHCEVADINYKQVNKISNQPIVQQVQNHAVNSLSGAASFLIALGEYLKIQSISSDHIQAIATGGSPISNKQINLIKQYFPKARIFILYGSSEAEPIAHIEIKGTLAKCDGYLVGKVAQGAKVVFESLTTQISNQAVIRDFENTQGEIYVSGKHVCKAYYKNDSANQKYKFVDQENTIWHRTGDIGYLNEYQQIVLTGRIENCIKTNESLMGSYPIELFVCDVLRVERCAAIENKIGQSVVYIENEISFDEPEVLSQINEKFKTNFEKIIKIDKIPLDTRHQGKIQYDQLK